MRLFALAAFLPMASVAVGQDTSVKVTYSTRASRASQVMKELSSIAKIDLLTAPQTENEVLVISVHDMPLSDLMAKIALATSGDWRHEGTSYRLIANAKVWRQEESEDLARRVADVQKAIQHRIAQAQKQREAMAKMIVEQQKGAEKGKDGKADKQADVDLESLMPQSPDESTVTALLQLADPTLIADIETGDRVVFSTDPTRTQHAFSGDTTELINELITKHNQLVSNTPPEQTEVTTAADQQQAELIRNYMRKQTAKIGVVSKALLVVSSSMFGFFGSLEVELRLYDPKGKVAYSTRSNLAVNGNAMFDLAGSDANSPVVVASSGAEAEPPEKVTTPTQPQGKRTPIDYSEDSKAMRKMTVGMMGQSANMTLPDQLLKKMYLPNIYDPLSFEDTDQILSYAKWKGKDLVADLPDGSDEGGFAMMMGNTANIETVEDYASKLKKGSVIVTVQDPNVTIVKPAHPYQARLKRLDRIALTNLLQASHDKGVPSLDDLAAFARVSPNPMSGGIGESYLILLVPGAMQMTMDGTGSWEMLRFYANLNQESRTILGSGGKLAIGSMDGQERTSVDKMVYGAGGRLSVDDGQKKQDDNPSWMSFAMDNLSGPNDYRAEPTELIPNGLPNDGFVDVKISAEPFASPAPGATTAMSLMLGVVGPDELALFKMMRSQKGNEQFSALLPTFSKLRVGERTILNFNFHLAPQVSLKQTLKDHHLPGDSTLYSEDNLPDEFKKKIAEREDALKKSPFGSMGSMFGGAPPIHP